ncbi:MAG: response regulator transcription factor [Epulopiscium sp.]|nr:response regulator transcription factor [Candidatus Epulonipiscium sp.]
MSMISLVLVDDHSMVRQGLKQLIELEEDIKVIAQAGDGKEGVQKVLENNPDIVLMDINMPHMNGIEAAKVLKQKKVNTKIIMLTLHNEVEYLFKTVELGIHGYVLKDSGSDILIAAIRSVYNGETYIQPNMATQLVHKIQYKQKTDLIETTAGEMEGLTKRELEVLTLIAEGLLNKEIGYELCISEKTVKNHVSNIFRKLNVNDRTQAAVYAIKNNIIQLT